MTMNKDKDCIISFVKTNGLVSSEYITELQKKVSDGYIARQLLQELI